MTVLGLDHVNIRVPDPSSTMAFLADILGMTPHDPFPGDPGFVGGWMLDEKGDPVIHVGSSGMTYPSDHWHPFDADAKGGPVHHVAFSCRGYEAVVARLCERDLAHSTNHIEQMGLRQVFVLEPGGVLLELNFFGD